MAFLEEYVEETRYSASETTNSAFSFTYGFELAPNYSSLTSEREGDHKQGFGEQPLPRRSLEMRMKPGPPCP